MLSSEQTRAQIIENELTSAIKTLQKPLVVDPFERHDYDSFIVECYQRQRSTGVQKKSLVQGSQSINAREAAMETPRATSVVSHAKQVAEQDRQRASRVTNQKSTNPYFDVVMTDTDQEKSHSPQKQRPRSSR